MLVCLNCRMLLWQVASAAPRELHDEAEGRVVHLEFEARTIDRLFAVGALKWPLRCDPELVSVSFTRRCFFSAVLLLHVSFGFCSLFFVVCCFFVFHSFFLCFFS